MFLGHGGSQIYSLLQQNCKSANFESISKFFQTVKYMWWYVLCMLLYWQTVSKWLLSSNLTNYRVVQDKGRESIEFWGFFPAGNPRICRSQIELSFQIQDMKWQTCDSHLTVLLFRKLLKNLWWRIRHQNTAFIRMFECISCDTEFKTCSFPAWILSFKREEMFWMDV